MPGLSDATCRFVRARLCAFFDGTNPKGLDEALARLERLYRLPRPAFLWRRPRSIDGGRTWAQTHVRGGEAPHHVTIEAVHPKRWRRESEDPSRAKWVDVILHELGHWADEADCEAFADEWARRVLAA